MFENDVKKYGIQTQQEIVEELTAFENDVKKYGIQTTLYLPYVGYKFENDVKKYGIQTMLLFRTLNDVPFFTLNGAVLA